MKAVVQRVVAARVRVGPDEVAAIGTGALVLLGVARGDTPHDATFLARKISQLRIFDDGAGKMNLAIGSVGGAFLVVSQFTLYGDCSGGNRPGYTEAAPPEEASLLYEAFVLRLRTLGHEVKTGVFREHMQVELSNDGPVTLILESRGRGAE